MNLRDQYYTPNEIALRMVSAVKGSDIHCVADFSAGDGSLLRAARIQWPKSSIIAIDVCTNNVKNLKRKEKKWQVFRQDFLNEPSEKKRREVERYRGAVSLVLLNPPFSCRGGAYQSVTFNETEVRCSTAFAFILKALQFLSSNGQLVAILPESCLYSDKDAQARILLHGLGKISIIGANGHKAFSGCTAHSVIILFQKGKKSGLNCEPWQNKHLHEPHQKNNEQVRIHRGKVQMHKFESSKSKKGLPFIHSTELQEAGIDIKRYRIKFNENGIRGPAVLLPRVCNPSQHKLIIYEKRSPLVLSDCIIALHCRNNAVANKLHKDMIDNWEHVRKEYTGTGARYITVNRIRKILVSMGYEVVEG
ncbi:MAG: N-6 DNA methylase [Nitrospirota bacterium]